MKSHLQELRRSARTLVTVLVLAGAPLSSSALTFAVDSTGDTADAVIDGVCRSTAGGCTLRAAIEEANATVALDMVDFALGAGIPRLNVGASTGAALPPVAQPLAINGNSGGATRIELNGSGLGGGAAGLSVTAGGTTVNALAIIGFPGNGLDLQGGSGNIVTGCFIGLDANGRGAGNGGHGIAVSRSDRNTIGGLASGAGNTIAFNGGAGVFVQSALENEIAGNSIHSNTALGIGLSPLGVTKNDDDDSDIGANRLQNFPELESAATDGVGTTIRGQLTSVPSSTFRLEFFSTSACDASGFGEGQSPIGTRDVTSSDVGVADFSFLLPSTVPIGHAVTATATGPDSTRDTSEFSSCIGVRAQPTGTATSTVTSTPSRTSSVTATPTSTPTRTLTRTPTSTIAPSPTRTVTPSPTHTVTRTSTVTATPRATASRSPSRTASYTPTQTQTGTATRTFSASRTPTTTPTPTTTATTRSSPTTASATPTSTVTRTATTRGTPTRSPTTAPASATSTPTRTSSARPSTTASTSPTATPRRSPTPTSTRPCPCMGDCNCDGRVVVSEIIACGNIALERIALGRCPSVDADGNGMVTIDEITAAIDVALNGCPR